MNAEQFEEIAESKSIPAYPVSIWEGVAVATGAVLLVITGLLGLGVKALNNAFNPERAEATAHSLMDYKIPGGAQGVFGANVGGAKVALVVSQTKLPGTAASSTANPFIPMTQLLIARVPNDNESDEKLAGSPLDQFSFLGFPITFEPQDMFQPSAARTESQPFCTTIAPVRIHKGTLISSQRSVPAIRYETEVLIDGTHHIAAIFAIGDHAEANAAATFSSLKCKDVPAANSKPATRYSSPR